MITVIGLGSQPLGEPALKALAEAALVVGGARHLEAVAALLAPQHRTVAVGGDLEPVLGALASEPGPAVALASGDPGFFGIVRTLAQRFGPSALRVIPGVSSVASAFARAGLSWDDAVVASAHGRDPAPAVNLCRRYPKVAVLTSPAFGPAALAAALGALERTLVVVEEIGTSRERVTTSSVAEIARQAFRDPNVVLCLREAAGQRSTQWPPRPTPIRWALPEEEFVHRDRMITKAEVRALALAWLGPGPGDLLWDVGAGSGAVAVEAARLGAAVIAIDADPAQCDRARANAARHGVPVEVVEGQAPAMLAELPDPDVVFVGGGGADVRAIVQAAAARAGRAVVVALATVERVGLARGALAAAGLDVEGVQLSVARLAPLGSGTRLAAENPVFLICGRRSS
ncbi:MAG: precorrin-6y C5,15-methyltransferase (decarboxylating) subunit CbiE [Egibacteraceae bacterium]